MRWTLPPSADATAGRRSLGRDLFATLRGVLGHRERRSALLALGAPAIGHLARYFTAVVPLATDELAALRRRAEAVPDAALRREALASIHEKAYHVYGGCMLATFMPPAARGPYVAAVAALETIYDYLDNLCDRLEGVPAAAYPTLHEALLDACDLEREPGDAYRDGPARDDGGYLRMLVERVRAHLHTLERYDLIAPGLREATRRYAELQTHKHLAPGAREARCEAWFAEHASRHPQLRWYEFAAACGSSLPVFALLAAAADPRIDAPAIDAVFSAYFPHVSGLHIMLDYFIDQAEDREHGELNFVACYRDGDEARERLSALTSATMLAIDAAPDAAHHRFLVRAMTGFYLSHAKVYRQGLSATGTAIIARSLAPSQE